MLIIKKNAAAIKEVYERKMKEIIIYHDNDIISSDLISNTHSSIFDEKAGIEFTDNFMELVSWYDNEGGYSN